jgi:hypothetical protein
MLVEVFIKRDGQISLKQLDLLKQQTVLKLLAMQPAKKTCGCSTKTNGNPVSKTLY